MKKAVLIFMLFIPFFNYGQNFELKGDFEGSETNELILIYTNIDNQRITDTLKILGGKFETTGKIKGIQRVFLIGNTDSNSMEDPNLGYFFLEPGKVDLKLEENNFKNIGVSNSPTHTEFEIINAKSLKIISEVDSLLKIKADQKLIQQELNKMKNLELNYATQYPSSPLSSYYVHFYMRQIQQDSLKKYYQNMSQSNKNSVYGEAIQEWINKKIVNTNDKAPDFDMIDINGQKVSLNSFKGKYLLIDFWAGWCVPCIKQLPELKFLYNKYGDQGFEILGVSFDKNREEWKKSVIEHEVQDWSQVFVGMENFRTKGSLSEKYGIQPIPAYILIDKDGKIVGRYLNASVQNRSLQELSSKLKDIFKTQ